MLKSSNEYRYEDYNNLGGARQKAAELIARYKPSKILEVGCADGYFSFALAKANPKSKIIAIDKVAEWMDEVNTNKKQLGLKNIWFKNINFFSLNGQKYECITTFIALPNICRCKNDLLRFFEKCKRMLVKNGKLILCEEFPEKVTNEPQKTGFELFKELGYTFFSENEIKNTLLGDGFRLIKTKDIITKRKPLDAKGTIGFLIDEMEMCKIDGTKFTPLDRILKKYGKKLDRVEVDQKITVMVFEKV